MWRVNLPCQTLLIQSPYHYLGSGMVFIFHLNSVAMKVFKENTVVLEGKISNYIAHSIEEFKPGYDKGFDIFSDEVIIYALLEYSKFLRPYSKIERIKYIYDKCVSFNCDTGLKPNEYEVDLEYDYDEESWFIKSKKNLDLPF